MPATQPKAASKDLAKNVKEARVAARAMAALSAADRDKALSAMRASLEQQRDVIEKANALDIANAKTAHLASALQGRLNVSGKKFEGMLSKVHHVLGMGQRTLVSSLTQWAWGGCKDYIPNAG